MSEKTTVSAEKTEAQSGNIISHKKKSDSSQFFNPPVDYIFFLQRTVGNLATSRLLIQRKDEKENDDSVAITLTYGDNADKSTVSAYAQGVIEDILKASGETSATISSTARDAHNQARVMYDNLVSQGVNAQKKLYGANGDKVIDVYVASKKAKKEKDDIISDMEAKINKLGCKKVSNHCADPKKLVVVDIKPSSIKNKDKFIKAAKAESRVSKFLKPPNDPAYHLEIPAK